MTSHTLGVEPFVVHFKATNSREVLLLILMCFETNAYSSAAVALCLDRFRMCTTTVSQERPKGKRNNRCSLHWRRK